MTQTGTAETMETTDDPEVGEGLASEAGSGTVTWVRACAVDEIEPGEAVAVDSEPAVAVFNADGTWYATDELCSHDKSSLAEGYVDGTEVECSWHFAKFCLLTGAALTLPATEGIRTYPTKVEDGVVYVGV